MILETAQCYQLHIEKSLVMDEELYKTAFPKHPMTIWVGDSGDNFFWTIQLLDQLLYQYTLRYKKVHTTIRISNLFHKKYKLWHGWKTEFTPPPQCMPDQYKHKIILLHTNNIILVKEKDLQSILELTHQSFCASIHTMKIKDIEKKIGTLSNPSKMPSYAWGISAKQCITGSKLSKDKWYYL